MSGEPGQAPDAVELGFAFFGYVLLPIAVVGTAYYGLVLRRLDTLHTPDDQPDSQPSR